MLEKLAKSAARFFVAQNIVKSEYQEIYAYGMEILLSTMVNGIIVLIISILSDTVLPSLIFFTAFIVMRSSAGGYHAKTHIGCMLILIAVHLSFIFLIRFITIDAIPLFSYLAVAYSCISVYLFAPVEHPNKPLSNNDKKKLRMKSLIFVLIISVTVVIMILFQHLEISFYLSCGVIVSSTGMISEIISLKFENDNKGVVAKTK